MKTVAINGAGQIGYAAAYEFGFHEWDVTIHARSKPDWELGQYKRYIAGEDPVPRADVVLDTIAFDKDDVERYDPDTMGRLIVISSASVYCDAQGRTLDEAATNGFPQFDGPLIESQSTVAPGPETYSTRKVRMENKALEIFGARATILRPGAIYGRHCRHPREWWFVKRILDGRSKIPLVFSGESRFHTTAADDIANFAEEASSHDWGGIYNIADDEAFSVYQIGQEIAAIMNRKVAFEVVDGPPIGTVGRTPWSVPAPFMISNAKAKALDDGLGETVGVGVGNFAHSIEWLADLNPTDWRNAFPQLAAYPWDLFDYEAEDRFFDEGA
ncbi:MAG: reductase [Pseudomonadota bacterium]